MFQESISLDVFQDQYWRKQPCRLGKLYMGAIDLCFEDLIGLAQEDNVESRLINQQSDRFELKFGPMTETHLSSGSMLMVQNLESYSYDLSQWISEHFSFLPRWRIEDVMATLANEGGNCGPHFDQYDVFLVQLAGTKTWTLDEGGHEDTDLVERSDIRLLKDFSPKAEFTQECGQVLYIPPGFGHHGIASDNCITLSIGIRNPLISEMASHLADLLVQEDFSDQSLSDEFSGAAIGQHEVSRLGEKLTQALTKSDLLSVWYGSYMTLPRDSGLIEQDPDFDIGIGEFRAANPQVSLDLPSRIACQPGWLFVNGEALALKADAPWLLELQQRREIETHAIPQADDYLLLALIQAGALDIYPDD